VVSFWLIVMEYKDLEVWKESRKLVNSVYALTKEFFKEELYGLKIPYRFYIFRQDLYLN